MLRFVPVHSVSQIPFSVVERLQQVGDVVQTPRYEYRVETHQVKLRFVEYAETVVVCYPRHGWDTSAALVVARAIDE